MPVKFLRESGNEMKKIRIYSKDEPIIKMGHCKIINNVTMIEVDGMCPKCGCELFPTKIELIGAGIDEYEVSFMCYNLKCDYKINGKLTSKELEDVFYIRGVIDELYSKM